MRGKPGDEDGKQYMLCCTIRRRTHSVSSLRGRYTMSDHGELINQLNEAITELHKLIRKDHEHMDVILHREINKYASEEMLGKILADIQEEIHKRKR
jgi:uncharacterized coiled-coil protein SlyX